MKDFHKYLTITETEKNWGFHITSVGHNKVYPGMVYPPRNDHPKTHLLNWHKGRILRGYHIVYISKGMGDFESEFQTIQQIKGGTCFLLCPGVWHRYKPCKTTGWEEYWVGFDGEFPNNLINKNFSKIKKTLINVGLDETLLILFQRIIEAVQNGIPGYHQIIPGATLEMLGYLFNISMQEEQRKFGSKNLINHSIFLLRENMENDVSFQDIAKKLSMGYSNFRKTFKSTTGISPSQFLINLRIKKAVELLRLTELSIKEISYQVGFKCEFYFSKVFKNKTGISPSTYRMMLKEKSNTDTYSSIKFKLAIPE